MLSTVVRCSLLLAGILLVGSPALGQTPTPTPGGDCCSPHAGPSCDIAACADCVCLDLDPPEPLCCAAGGDGWDELCVALASSPADCAAECQCGVEPTPTPTPGGDCCTDHAGADCDEAPCSDCVCDIDPLCCSLSWDATCVSIARTVDECAGSCTSCTPLPTEPPDGTPTPGPCCEGRDLNPGCDEARCESCVCGVDGVCCSDTWDDSCVVIAQEECALDCACPDDGACCTDHEGFGCDDLQCQDCVVAQDDECGEFWDANCADRAATECALECPCGDCCADQGDIPGCGEKTCQDCVCDVDPACCDFEEGWDERCVDVANNECSIACPCGDCCEPVESGSEIVGCGEKPCQDCVCALDSNCCDTEWDGICAARATEECERRCSCEATNNCCDPGDDQAGCEISECEACVCGEDSVCCDDLWDGTCADIANVECVADCLCGPAPGDCVGDCNGDGVVAINELIIGVNISLETQPVSACLAFDSNNSGAVEINELIQGVNSSLSGCP